MVGTHHPSPILWVTRPEPGATQTCQRFRAMNCDPRAVPLTQIDSLLHDEMTNPALTEFDYKNGAIAVTSANAIRHFPKGILQNELMQKLRDVPLFAVGQATADAARDAGFRNIRTGAGDGAQLARMIVEDHGIVRPVLYLAGKTRTGTLEDELSRIGATKIRILDVYDTYKVSQITYIKKAIAEGQLPNCVLIYSLLSAQALLEQITASDSAHLFDKSVFFCISRRVADALISIAPAQKIVIEEPNEDAMLDAVAAYLASVS